MVGVKGVSGSAAGRGARVARGRGGFSLGASAADAPAAVQGAAPAQGIGLLTLQEATPGAERDAPARRRAEAALLSLRDLQLGLLAGTVDPARLRALAASPAGSEADDPALGAVLAAVRLRARVELARLGLDPPPSRD
jgi:hypothetical protein